jgi:hypothetical protein
MPNWVYNKIEIKGDESTLDLIDRSVRNESEDSDERTPFTYQNILPRPAESEADWYNWNIQNWGTKWDASDVESQRTPGLLAYRFSSPWSPPVPVVSTLSAQHPSVVINHTYEEEQGFGAVVEFTAGNAVQMKSWDIPDSHAEIVSRGGDCYCSDAESYYEDCFSERARSRIDLDQRVREVAVTLGRGWSGTFDELIAASSRL